MTSKEMIIPMMMRLRAVASVMASVHAWDALTISLWTHRLFVVAGLAGCCYMHLQIVLYASRVPVAGAGHHFVKDAGWPASCKQNGGLWVLMHKQKRSELG